MYVQFENACKKRTKVHFNFKIHTKKAKMKKKMQKGQKCKQKNMPKKIGGVVVL